jgi:hypothetical protein
MSAEPEQVSSHIGTLNEKNLHALLKDWYAEPDDQFEVSLDGYFIDIVRDDLLIEIQTRNFGAMKRKLLDLTARHKVRLVHPIAEQKWIIKLPKNGKGKETRRKSPKKGMLEHIFDELVYIPKLMSIPNFSLEVLLIHEEEVRRHDGNRSWRRKGWAAQERRLLKVVDQQVYSTPEDMCAYIPSGLPEPFSTADLANGMDRPRSLAQKVAYCLREMGAITAVGKKGNAILYSRESVS